jgi:hypothetical protein
VATAIVSGALANKPRNGGEAWVRLSWILGLRRLGFDTYFVEQIDAADCRDEDGGPADFADSVNCRHFEAVVRDFGLEGRVGLLCDGGREAVGLGLAELRDVAAGADVLLNSGHLAIETVLAPPRRRVYVDLDPGFTQAWHADEALAFRLAGHDRYVTVGLNVGVPGWPIPAAGVDWIPTLPPVVLDEWPLRAPVGGPPRFTTIATWRSPYGGLEIGGRRLGLKHHEMRRLIELPERAPGASFEIALDIHPGDSGDLEALVAHGWKIVDPLVAGGGPAAFRDYVSASGAEFSVAQGVYVDTRSGWFSDRTAAYLACGRPALVQDTGIGDKLPLGAGLLTFSGLDDAVATVAVAAADLGGQGAAARAFAERHLDSDLVLGRLLSTIWVEG